MPRLESFLRFDYLLRMRGLGRCLKLFSQKILWTLKLIPDSKNINENNPNNAEVLQIYSYPLKAILPLLKKTKTYKFKTIHFHY